MPIFAFLGRTFLGLALYWWILLVVAALVASGLIYNWLNPDRRERTTETSTLTRRIEEERQARVEAERKLKVQEDTLAVLTARVAEQERRAANIVTTREITRFVPGPSGVGPAPVVVVRDGAPQPAPVALTPGMISEIVRETVTDLSTEERGKTTDTGSTTTTAKTTEDASKSTSTVSETVKTDEKATTTTTTETGGSGGDGDGGKLGVGVTSEAKPFVSLDLVQVPLGPRVFKLGKAGAGVFVTAPLKSGFEKELNGGPQVSYSRKRFFGMVGWKVIRDQGPVAGVGLRF